MGTYFSHIYYLHEKFYKSENPIIGRVSLKPASWHKNENECLVLSVIFQGERGYTDYIDFVLAVGRKESSKYIGRDDIWKFVEGISYKELVGMVSGEVLWKYRKKKGLNVQLLFCDIGSGGGISKVYAQSRRYPVNSF